MTDTLTDSAPRRSLWRHRDFLLLRGGQPVSEIGSYTAVAWVFFSPLRHMRDVFDPA